MKIVTKRCIKCRKTYNFWLAGYNADNKNNNEHYCPDCMVIINDALDKAVKYEDIIKPKIKKIDNVSQDIVEKIEKLDKEYISNTNSVINDMLSMRMSQPLALTGVFEDFDNIEKYAIDKVYYYKGRNKSTDEIEYFTEYEYTDKDDFSDILYKNLNESGDRKINTYQFKLPKISDVPEIPLTEPEGKLFYFDIKGL